MTFADLVQRGSLLVNDGYRTKSEELGRPGIPILRVAEVQDGHLSPSFGDHVRDEFRGKIGVKTSEPRDVVLTTKGTVGRVARIPAVGPVFVYSPQVCFFRVIDRSLDPRWLYYWFSGSQFRGQAAGVQSQTDMAAYINLADLRGMTLSLPALLEQRGIAATLGALDDKIESNRRIVHHAEDQLTALAELSAHEDSRRVELGESVRVVKEGIQPAGLGRDVVEHFSLPAFDASAMPDRVPADTVLSNKLRVPGPCILLSRLNPRTDRTWYVEPDRPEVAMASTEFLVLTARSGTSIGAVWLALRAREFRASLIRRVTGTSGSHQRVKPADVLSIETLDARSLDVDSWMAADQLLAVIHQRRVESQRLRAVRATLLPELLSGRLRVPEAREAVAEVVDAHD